MPKANGLKLHTIKLEKKPKPLSINSLDDIKNYIKTESLIVAYLDYTVLLGRYRNSAFEFVDSHSLDTNFKYVQRLRIFNKDEELLIWRSENGFKGRYRRDYEGDEMDVVDAEQVLFGTDADDLKNRFTKLFEKRGTEIILPFPFVELDVKDKTEGKRIFIQTRNYIDYNKACQATYVDCRFMGFTNNGKDLT